MTMNRSGYPATTRQQVVMAAVQRWEKMCQLADGGGRPIHQAKEKQKASRRLELEIKVVSWYKGE